jgi:hypothetical protein
MKVTTATALVAWAATALAYPQVPSALRGSCPGLEDIQALGRKLSSTAHIYFPGSDEFVLASKRWSQLGAPKVDIVVVPGTERDVSETVSSPVKCNATAPRALPPHADELPC